MTDTSVEIDLQSKQDITCLVAKVKLARSVHSMSDVIPFLSYLIFPWNQTKIYFTHYKENIRNVFRVLRVSPREDQADVTHAISPISLKLSQMIKVIKLFKSPE